MTITLFGIIWACANFTCFFMSMEKMLYLLLLSCVLQASSVAYIGDLAIVPYVFTSALFIMKCLHKGVTFEKLSKAEIMVVVFFLFVLIYTVFSLIVFQGMPVATSFKFDYYNMRAIPVFTPLKLTTLHVTNFIILLLSCLDFFFINRMKNLISTEWLSKSFQGIIVLVLFLGLIQYIIVNLGASTKIIEALLYSKTDSISSNSLNSGNRYRLYSTFSEPSYCANFLAAAFWYLYIKEKRITILSAIVLIEVLLTRSVTGYVAILCGAIIYIALYMGNLKRIIQLLSIIMIILLALWTLGYLQTIINIPLKKLNSFSMADRSTRDYEALSTFIKSYFIGVGFSSIRASSLLINLLAQIGIMGTILFTRFIIINLKPILAKKTNAVFQAHAMFLIIVLVGAIIACPDLTFPVLWLGLFTVSCIQH